MTIDHRVYASDGCASWDPPPRPGPRWDFSPWGSEFVFYARGISNGATHRTHSMADMEAILRGSEAGAAFEGFVGQVLGRNSIPVPGMSYPTRNYLVGASEFVVGGGPAIFKFVCATPAWSFEFPNGIESLPEADRVYDLTLYGPDHEFVRGTKAKSDEPKESRDDRYDAWCMVHRICHVLRLWQWRREHL